MRIPEYVEKRVFVIINKVTIEGYGPWDLINRVENNAVWTCSGQGINFTIIAFGSMVLTLPADALCPTKYRITFLSFPNGRGFQVEGFQIASFCANILASMKDPFFKITIDGIELRDLTIGDLHKEENKNLIAYRLIVEQI